MENIKQRVCAGKRYSSSASLLLLACTATPAFTANLPTLVLNDPTNTPFTTEVGDGFLDIIVGEAFRRAGFNLKLIKLPAERALMNANAGIEDGDLSRIAGLEKNYPNLVRVPEKILDMHFVAFTRKPKPTAASWQELDSYAVGYIKGWKVFEQNLLATTHVSTADDPGQLISMLDKGRIEIALYDRWMGYALVKRMNIADARVVEPPLAVREMFIYLHQRHADKLPAITAALRAIKAEGVYTKVCLEKFAPLATPSSQCEVK